MGALFNGAYLSDVDGHLVYHPELANCNYVSKKCSAAFRSPFPGKFQNFSSIQVIELTKSVKAGDEYLVSYGTKYKKSHLSSGDKPEHAKATDDKENDKKQNIDLPDKTSEGDLLFCFETFILNF